MGSVVLRNFKRSPHFFRGAGSVTGMLPLQARETVVGIYRNPAPWEGSQVVFTDDGLWLADSDQILKIQWSDIVDYETLDPNGNVDGVRLRTKDGIRFARIAGAYGPDLKFRDSFNFAMILRSLLGK